jgi:hypothetical protein
MVWWHQDALNMYHAFADLAHIWDDLVDKDKPVAPADRINRAFLTCLGHLPGKSVLPSVFKTRFCPCGCTVVSAYETANFFEANEDRHGIEIAHGLRYASAILLLTQFMFVLALKQAKEVLP